MNIKKKNSINASLNDIDKQPSFKYMCAVSGICYTEFHIQASNICL